MYLPRIIVAEVIFLQLARASDRLRIEVERMNTSAESTRSEAEETAARADVEKRFALKRIDFKHFFERLLGLLNALVVDTGQELRPVLPEFEALSASDFSGVRVRRHVLSTDYADQYLIK